MSNAESDNDFVGQVRIEGTQEATSQLVKMGDEGATAFDKIGKASEDAAKKVKKSSDEQVKANDKATDSTEALKEQVEQLGDTLSPRALPADAAKELESSISTLLTSMRKGIKDVFEFGTRVAALGAAGTAAGIGLLAAARGVAQTLNSQTDAVDKQLQAQTALINEQGQASQSAINYNSNLRQLNAQLANGTIDYATYNKQLTTTKANYQEQIRVQGELADSQELTRIELERLQKQAADTKAFNALADALGGPLVSSLFQLGNQVEAIRRDIVTTFSPAGASIVDAFGNAFDKSSKMITDFVSTTSTQIQSLIAQNGPAIDQAVSGIIGVVQTLLSSLIAAGPVILRLVNSVVIPAFQGVLTVLNQIAGVINNVFGTEINAAFLIGLAGVLKFTKAFQALFAITAVVGNLIAVMRNLGTAVAFVTGNVGGLVGVVRLLLSLFTPWGLAITALAAAFLLLRNSIDWNAFATAASQAAQVIQNAWSAVVNFFTVTLPNSITAAKDYVVDTWNAVVDFFATLPDRVASIFAQVANAITNAISQAAANALNTIRGWAKSALEYLKPIIDLMNTIGAAEGGLDTSGAPRFAGGGHVGSGHVRGPGTGTSDSIFAMLSNNEFVMKARAVRKYGLSFMRAVNSGVFDLSRLRGYATGGLVSIPPLSVPMGAGGGNSDGGASSALRPMTFVIGGEVFEGLLAPEHVAAKLGRFANTKNTQSAGRRPSWVS